MSDSGSGDFDTISTSSGNLYLQNGNVTITQAGDVTANSFQNTAGTAGINSDGSGYFADGNITFNTDGSASFAGGKATIDSSGNITSSGTIQGATLTDGAGTTISGGTVNAYNVVIGNPNTGNTANLHIVNNALHFSENVNGGSIVMSDSGVGDFDTISTSSGNLYLQNGNVTISQQGDITSKSVTTKSFTLGGGPGAPAPVTVNGIATGPAGYNNSLLATKGYVDAKADRATRGIVMTAALQTPTIEAGDNNAVKFSAAGYGNKAGFSLGYARRIWKGLSADVEAAADDQFEDGVVRGGVNFSF